jgi:hypothetical protein
MKGETWKIYMSLLSFYKSTIIPMIRWSFVRAGFFLKPENLLSSVGVNGTRILERIEVPELPVDEAFMYPETINLSTQPGIPTRRRAPVPGPTSFAVILAAYIEKVTGTFPLCGHDDDAEVSDDEEDQIDSTFAVTIIWPISLSD